MQKGLAEQLLRDYRGITALDLSNNELQQVPEYLQHLTWLEKLSLSGNSLQRFELAQPLTNLKELTLDSNKIWCVSENITGLQALQTLSLQGNELQQLPPLLHLLEQLPALRSLTLAGNPVAKLASYRSSVLAALTQLTSLDGAYIQAEHGCFQVASADPAGGHDGLGSESRLPLIQLPDALLEKLGLAEQRCEHLGQQLVEAQQEAQSCQAQLRAAQQHATNLEVQLERMHHELVKENGLMEMRIASLQKIISLQEEQLMRGELCEPGQADAEAPSVAVLARWRQEVFGLLLREAQAEVAAKEQQAQHEAVLAELQRGSQEQIQLLSLQAADVRAELQVERGRGKQAAAGLQEATWQIASLESKLQQSNVSLEALAQHAQRTNAQLIQTATDGKAAMRRLEAYAHRLAFAEERLRYAVKLSAIGEASASGALASSSDSQQQQAASAAAAPGTQAQNTADVRLLSSPAEVLRLEVRRLMADRDLLLQKVEAVRRKQDVVVREAVEATNQQAAADMEERLQAELASHMEKMQSQLRLQHCQLCQELQENEQRCREAVESAQEAARAAQAQLAVAQQAAAQEVAQLQGALAAATAEVAKQATQHATEQAALRSELQQAHSNELHAAVEKVQAEQEALRRGMQEQQSQELSRAVAEAEASRREAQQASTALRQFQRQLGKLKQQNSTDLKAVIQDLEAKLAAKEAAFRSMRQERNALLSVLRKQGNSDPASTTANSPHPDAAIPGAATCEPGDQMYWTETGAQVLDVGHRQASATGGTARTGPQDSANDGLTAPDPTLLQKLADLQELTRELLRD
ncbi:hypothetical protein WJX72_007466 [[Myrmecia] bisecta]|uniref:Alpha-helical coiled-coil rod protein n=1 Tax=[Myrmecia] bisecta TaxID=41462 RepID=A0AAW1PP19_9CHLO